MNNENLKDYTILKDVTIAGIPYTAGQTQKFTDENIANIDESVIILSSEYAGSPAPEEAPEVSDEQVADVEPETTEDETPEEVAI